MKRFFRILGIFMAVVVALVGCAASFIGIKGIPTYEPNIPDHIARLEVKPDSALVARGANIAAMMCKHCHVGADGKLTGMIMKDLPKEFGTVATYNITQDKEHGIGAWTDGELYYFLRTGIRTDGSWAPPFMPKFPRMAEEDLHAVIAWLRSDDPSLQPDSREYPPNQYNFLVKFLANTMFSAPKLPGQPIAIPDSTDRVAFGRYVANDLTGCYNCHSGDLKKLNGETPELSFGFYGGGTPMLDLEGNIVPTANLTMDPETGIGNWTEQEFINAVKYCKNPRGGTLHYPMLPHTTLSDNEVAAVFAYLKTVPVLVHKVERFKEKE